MNKVPKHEEIIQIKIPENLTFITRKISPPSHKNKLQSKQIFKILYEYPSLHNQQKANASELYHL